MCRHFYVLETYLETASYGRFKILLIVEIILEDFANQTRNMRIDPKTFFL